MIKELRIEVNKRCNLACEHCYTEKTGKLLDIHLFEALINNSAERGVSSLSLTGGEPLLDLERTKALIRCGVDNQLRVRLNTNGWFLTEEIASSIKDVGLSEVQISLSYSTADAFDSFARRNGTFNRVIAAIQNSVNQELSTTIRFTLLSNNVRHLTQTYLLACKLRVNKFKVRRIVEVNGILDSSSKESELEMDQEIDCLSRQAMISQVPVEFSDGGESNFKSHKFFQRLECKCGVHAAFVSSDGLVSPCPFLREEPQFIAGSIKNQDLLEITQGPIFNNFIGNRASDSTCGNDEVGGCKAMSCCKSVNPLNSSLRVL